MKPRVGVLRHEQSWRMCMAADGQQGREDSLVRQINDRADD